MNEEQQIKAVYAIIGITVTGIVAKYTSLVRKELKKRKQIEAWKQENIACIHASRDRLLEMLNSPDPLSHGEFWNAWREEHEFLNIVQNQPKYEI
jgi:hypothetical protein